MTHGLIVSHLCHDLGSQVVGQGQYQSRHGQKGEESGVPVPDKDELEGEQGRGDGRIPVLVPAQDGVGVDDQLPPALQARLDSARLNHVVDAETRHKVSQKTS